MLRIRSKGQTTLEVVILIGFVVAALIAMGVYMKRGIQGRLRDSTDQIGEQYSAGHVSSEYITESHMYQNEKLHEGGAIDTVIDTNQQTKSGHENISDFTPGW